MRDEYPAVLDIHGREIAALEAAGVVEPGYIDLRSGAEAYICGDDRIDRGQARIATSLPPCVAQVGIFGRPTLVHNV